MLVAAVSLQAVSKVDLRHVPTWAILAIAVIIWAGFVAAVVRIFPAGQRARQLRRVLPPLFVLLLGTTIAPSRRGGLWLGVVIAAAAIPALLWYGKLPTDLPPAGDPRRRRHPRYADIEARGRRIGYVMVVSIVGLVVASYALVQGP